MPKFFKKKRSKIPRFSTFRIIFLPIWPISRRIPHSKSNERIPQKIDPPEKKKGLLGVGARQKKDYKTQVKKEQKKKEMTKKKKTQRQERRKKTKKKIKQKKMKKKKKKKKKKKTRKLMMKMMLMKRQSCMR